MKKILSTALLILIAAMLFGCGNSDGLTALVSEYRSEIYTAESEGAALQAFYSEKEYPYAADGIVADITRYFEVQATLPDNTLTYTVAFQIDGKSYGGEMSYDSVKQIFTYSQSLTKPAENEIVFTVTAEGENAPTYTLQAKRAEENKISLSALLEKVSTDQKDTLKQFAGDKFNGEIYVRLMLQESKCYYFVGFIDRSGNTLSFLADAKNGEVLATRTF